MCRFVCVAIFGIGISGASAQDFSSMADVGMSMGVATNQQVIGNATLNPNAPQNLRNRRNRRTAGSGTVVQNNANLPKWEGVRYFDTNTSRGPAKMACTSDQRGLICRRAG